MNRLKTFVAIGLVLSITVINFSKTHHITAQSNLPIITAENANRLTQIGRLGNGRVVSAQYTANVQTLAVLGTLGIWLYDQSDPTASPRLLQNTHGGPHSMAVHPIENTLAMGNRDGTISFWSIETGTETLTLQAHQTPVRLLAFNADGTRLASAGGAVFDQEIGITVDDVAKLWDVASGTEIATLINEDDLTPSQFIFLPNAPILVINFATTCSDAPSNVLEFFDSQTGRAIEPLDWNPTFNQFFAINRDGTRIAVGKTYEPEVSVLDTTSQAILFEHTDNQSWFNYTKIMFSPDDTLLVGVREDFYYDQTMPGQIEIWDYANNQLVDVLQYSTVVNDALLSPDGQTLVVITGDGVIYYYDFTPELTQKVNLQHVFSGYTEKIALHPNEPLLAVTEKQRTWHESSITIGLWDYTSGEVVAAHPAYQITDLAIDPDGSQLAFSDKTGNVTFLDLPDMGQLSTLETNLHDIWSMAFDAANKKLLTIGSSDQWQLWQQEGDSDYQLVAESQSDEPVYAIAFSPNSTWMAYANGYDGPVLYELASSRTVEAPIKDASRSLSIESITYSPDGKTIALGSKFVYGCNRAGNVQIWRVPDLELLTTFEDHTEEVTAVVFSADGLLLASSSEDGKIHIRRSDTYEMLAILEGHLGYGVNSIAFTPDGRLLISAGDDGVIRLWGIAE